MLFIARRDQEGISSRSYFEDPQYWKYRGDRFRGRQSQVFMRGEEIRGRERDVVEVGVMNECKR